MTGAIQSIAASFGNENLKLITPWIFSLYMFIITGKLIKAVYSWYQFKYQFKTGLLKPTVDLKLFTELKAHQFGIKRKVKLWLSNSVQTPVTCCRCGLVIARSSARITSGPALCLKCLAKEKNPPFSTRLRAYRLAKRPNSKAPGRTDLFYASQHRRMGTRPVQPELGILGPARSRPWPRTSPGSAFIAKNPAEL